MDIDYALLDFDDPPKQKPKPGNCSKCGKHIGRGVRTHEKSCKG